MATDYDLDGQRAFFDRLAELEIENTQLKLQLEAANMMIDAKNHHVNEVYDTHAQWRDTHRKSLAGVVESANEFQKVYGGFQSQNVELRKINDELRAENNALRADLSSASQEPARLGAMVAALTTERDQLQKQLHNCHNKSPTQLAADCSEQQQTIDKLTAYILQLKIDHEKQLQDQYDLFYGEIEKNAKTIQSMRRSTGSRRSSPRSSPRSPY